KFLSQLFGSANRNNQSWGSWLVRHRYLNEARTLRTVELCGILGEGLTHDVLNVSHSDQLDVITLLGRVPLCRSSLLAADRTERSFTADLIPPILKQDLEPSLTCSRWTSPVNVAL